MTGVLTDAEARDRLEAERRRAAARLVALRGDHASFVAASRDTNADDEHDPEGHTIAFERSQVEALARQAETRLEEVDAALARLAAGAYGTCRRCGRSIPVERLRVRPTALACVTCG